MLLLTLAGVDGVPLRSLLGFEKAGAPAPSRPLLLK